MDIKEITDKTIWESFIGKYDSASFLQSWSWGQVEESLGQEIQRLGFYQNGNLKTVCLIVFQKITRGNFIFVPHGPVVSQKDKKFYKTVIQKLISYLKNLPEIKDYSFIRIAPTLLDNPENKTIFKSLKFKTAPIYLHAESIWALKVDNKSEEELLTDMRKTTRYLIRRAIKDEIIIEKRTDMNAVDDFYKLYEKTAQREHFSAFSKKYVRTEFESFLKNNQALFLFGRLKNSKDYLASALILFTEQGGYYHQGASIHSKHPVPYLLQWEAIKETKKRGCKNYNFWGIYDGNRTPKAWEGLTLFKMGFSGYKVTYLPTQDLILSPKYYLTFLWEKYLAYRRGIKVI